MPVAVHMAKRVPPIDWTGVPEQYKGKCSAVCRTVEECEGLGRWFGSRDFCPYLPVMVMVPGADAPTLIAGLGYATVAELEACAVVTWYRQTDKLAKTGHLADFNALRERRGLMRREDVDAATREALAQRIARHKANPVSDPFRQPVYPNPTGRLRFPVGKKVTDGKRMD